jgi:hypothetical protein
VFLQCLGKAKIQEFGVGHELRVLFDCIETAGDGLISFIGIQAWRLVGSILNGGEFHGPIPPRFASV